MNILQTVKSISLLILLSVLVSCSATDGNNTTGASAETGRVTLLVTDGVTDDFDEVNLTVKSISFIGEDDGHETIVFDESRVINLLALQNYSDWLITAVIPAGIYEKIRMEVTQVELVKEGQAPIITKLPANGKVDLNPQGTFEVFAGEDLMIQLDVDAEKSIHTIKKGNGEYSYNFRPVVFVNIMGVDDLKLVLLDGKVLARTEAGFQLCDAQDLEINDNCLAVSISGNTVVQDDLIEVVPAANLVDGDIVTVLGKASSKNIDALHIVIEAKDKKVSDLALFNGVATSDFDVDHFTMDAEIDDDVVIQPLTLAALTVALVEGSGVRVFDKNGNIVKAETIVVGTDVDVFGKAEPDLSTVSKVKMAFGIIDNDEIDNKISGTIAAINKTESQITVTAVNYNGFDGDVCVDINETIILILGIVDKKVVAKEITINELQIEMPIDVYGQDNGLSCVAADVILVAQPLAVTPASATLLVTGN